MLTESIEAISEYIENHLYKSEDTDNTVLCWIDRKQRKPGPAYDGSITDIDINLYIIHTL